MKDNQWLDKSAQLAELWNALDDHFDTGVLDDEAVDHINSTVAHIIDTLVREAYIKGYNDNARDCYCDSPGATEGVLAHHHLMDDGESLDIKPDIAELKESNNED